MSCKLPTPVSTCRFGALGTPMRACIRQSRSSSSVNGGSRYRQILLIGPAGCGLQRLLGQQPLQRFHLIPWRTLDWQMADLSGCIASLGD